MNLESVFLNKIMRMKYRYKYLVHSWWASRAAIFSFKMLEKLACPNSMELLTASASFLQTFYYSARLNALYCSAGTLA